MDGCMAVVFMGCDKSVYYYSKEKGFFEPPERFVFEEPGVDAAAALAASRQVVDMMVAIERFRAEAEAEDLAKHDGVSLQDLDELRRLINEVRVDLNK